VEKPRRIKSETFCRPSRDWKSNMVEHYTYQVSWSEEDHEFVATCAEFPSLSWLAPDRVAALRGIEGLVADVIADLKKSGEPVPEPMAEREYSGRFVVRTTAALHRRLAIEAAEKHVSLNRYVNLKLATG
jgi:predicted RNase H-like HicB family nuclease